MKIEKIVNFISSFFLTWKYFKFETAFYQKLYPYIGIWESKDERIKKKHFYIEKYLLTRYGNIIDEFKYKKNQINEKYLETNYPVWVCWWQGEKNMPQIVKACYNSLRNNNNGNSIILITKDNYNKYVNIPEFIIEKIDRKEISITHFSDILRVFLIYEHGGMWIDATILVTHSLPKNIDAAIFSIKRGNDGYWVSQCRWTAYLLFGMKKSILFDFLKNILIEYWKKENAMLDYLLIDYLISIGYDKISLIKEMIDNIPITNKDVQVLEKILNEKYDPLLYKKIISSTNFHKLTYKEKVQSFTNTGDLTYYGYIIEQNDL